MELFRMITSIRSSMVFCHVSCLVILIWIIGCPCGANEPPTIAVVVPSEPQDCSASILPRNTYDETIQRIEDGDCLPFGARIGMCGEFLYIIESSGFHGAEYYFDSDNGELIAQSVFDDTSPSFFTCGQVECEPELTEILSCVPVVPEP